MSSGWSRTRSCRRGPSPGASVRPTMLPGLGVEGPGQDGGQVAARVAVRVLDLEPEPDGAVLADECGRRGRAGASTAGPCGRSSASASGAVAAGHELAQRHQVGLAGQALERSGDEGGRCPGGAAVAGLVAPTRAARAGLARTDGSRLLRRRLCAAASVRLRWRDFFPMRRTLGGREGAWSGRRWPPGRSRRGRAGRARWCGSGCSPPTSGQPGSRRSRAPPGEVGDAGLDALGCGQGAAVGDGDVDGGVDGGPRDAHGAVGERTGVAHRVADQLADHEAGVVTGLVAGAERAHPVHELPGGRRSRSRGGMAGRGPSGRSQRSPWWFPSCHPPGVRVPARSCYFCAQVSRCFPPRQPINSSLNFLRYVTSRPVCR